MKKILFVVAILFGTIGLSKAINITAIASGQWAATTTWDCGCLPTNVDNVNIPTPYNVTLTAAIWLMNLNSAVVTITVGGTLTLTSSTITLDNSDLMKILPGGQVVAAGLGGSVISGGVTIGMSPGTTTPGPRTITGGTLPVTLISFKGTQLENSILLNWSSASEKNFDYYAIERSTDGKNFETVGEVRGAGTSVTKKDYQFADEKISEGTFYYRLKSVDFDKFTATFSMIGVSYDPTTKSVNVYPNPIAGRKLKFVVNFKPEAEDFFTIRSIIGVGYGRYSFVEGENEFMLPDNMDSGIYFIQITHKLGTVTTRIILR